MGAELPPWRGIGEIGNLKRAKLARARIRVSQLSGTAFLVIAAVVIAEYWLLAVVIPLLGFTLFNAVSTLRRTSKSWNVRRISLWISAQVLVEVAPSGPVSGFSNSPTAQTRCCC
jgi:hypothetical protein